MRAIGICHRQGNWRSLFSSPAASLDGESAGSVLGLTEMPGLRRPDGVGRGSAARAHSVTVGSRPSSKHVSFRSHVILGQISRDLSPNVVRCHSSPVRRRTRQQDLGSKLVRRWAELSGPQRELALPSRGCFVPVRQGGMAREAVALPIMNQTPTTC